MGLRDTLLNHIPACRSEFLSFPSSESEIFKSPGKQEKWILNIWFLQDGAWNGGIKDILDGIADIGAATFSATYIRSTAVDFSFSFREAPNHFFLKNPEASYSWTSFLKPLNTTTWYILLLMIIICALSLAIMAKLAKDKNSSEFSFSKSFIYSFGAYCAISARRFVN